MKKGIFFILIFIIFFITKTNNLIPKYDLENNSITNELLYFKIKTSGILFPEVVYSQALIESGNFSSEVFVCTNNLFGMKQPKVRDTYSLGKSNLGYASYFSWKSSVDDYKLWQDRALRNKTLKTQKEYLEYLGRVYAEDKQYIMKLQKIIHTNKVFFEPKKNNYEKV